MENPPKTDKKEADIASYDNLMKELRKSSEAFGKSLSDAFAKGIVDGKRLEDVLKNIGKALAESTLKTALKPLELSLASAFEKGFSNLFSGLNPFGDAPNQPLNIRPFAAGGVIGSPTYFPMADSIGLMGERGAEAIMPLARGNDGRLGVRATGGAGGASIVINITTPDVEGFRRSEAQLSAAMARALARGNRAT
jgi:phage-related minor tail protein